MSVPRVGVGVFVFHKSEKLLFILGQRKGSHGAGTFALPGGHLEHGESFEQCAAREVLEETGLAVSDTKFLTATNSVFVDSGQHYVTIFMTARVTGNVTEPQLTEPEKCAGWAWSTFSQMRKLHEERKAELFLPLVELMKTRPEICEILEQGQGS